MRRFLILTGAGLAAAGHAILRWGIEVILFVALCPVAAALVVTGLVSQVVARRRPGPEDQPVARRAVDVVVLPTGNPGDRTRSIDAVRAASLPSARIHVACVQGADARDLAGGPEVSVLPPVRNRAEARMAAAAASTADLLVFLDAGIEPSPEQLRALLEPFAAGAVFATEDPALAPTSLDGVRESLAIERGGVALEVATPGRGDAWLRTLGPSPSGCAIDRRRLARLGGFTHPLLAAARCDRALGLRAAQLGWTVLLRTPKAGAAAASALAVRTEIAPREQAALLWSGTTALTTLLLHGLRFPAMALRWLRNGSTAAAQSAAPQSGSWIPFWWLRELGAIAWMLPRLVHLRRNLLAAAPAGRPAAANDQAALALPLRREPDGPDPGGKLAVLVVSGRVPRRNVDGSWVLYERLRELARNHRVRLVAFAEVPIPAGELESLRTFCEELVLLPLGRTPVLADVHRLWPRRLARDYSAPALRERLRRALAAQPFDVIQVEYVEAGHVALDLVRGLPSVYTVHEALSLHAIRVAAGMPAASRRPALREAAQWALRERQILREFARVVALSSTDAAWLQRLAPATRVTTIPSGIAFGPATAGAPVATAAPVIAFVGNYQHGPNVDAACWLAREIFPRVRAQAPAAQLLLMGREPTQAVSALASEPGVTVAGYVPDLQARLDAATVVAVPIRLGGGLRGKCLEAWAQGKAVVATPTACEGFAVTDGVHVLLAADAPTFAQNLLRCLADPGLCAALGARARALVTERYSVTAAASAFAGLYRELLGSTTDG